MEIKTVEEMRSNLNNVRMANCGYLSGVEEDLKRIGEETDFYISRLSSDEKKELKRFYKVGYDSELSKKVQDESRNMHEEIFKNNWREFMPSEDDLTMLYEKKRWEDTRPYSFFEKIKASVKSFMYSIGLGDREGMEKVEPLSSEQVKENMGLNSVRRSSCGEKTSYEEDVKRMDNEVKDFLEHISEDNKKELRGVYKAGDNNELYKAIQKENRDNYEKIIESAFVNLHGKEKAGKIFEEKMLMDSPNVKDFLNENKKEVVKNIDEIEKIDMNKYKENANFSVNNLDNEKKLRKSFPKLSPK